MYCNDCFHPSVETSPHFHLMTTMRDIDQDRFKNKNRDWNDKQYLDHYERMGTLYNHALTLANSPARIDHRSLKAHTDDREPTNIKGRRRLPSAGPWWLLTGSAG
jgi:hypothetical protein